MGQHSIAKLTRSVSPTPLMRQYNAIKGKYPDALLLFRIGDFYETFEDDARVASRLLNIALTKRANGSSSHVALAGFPHHALDTYLPKLIQAGHRVAVCDQLEDPRFVKGIVKRGVTELATPGLVVSDSGLSAKENNLLASVFLAEDQSAGLALLDLSTGEFWAFQGTTKAVQQHFLAQTPRELIFAKPQRALIHNLFPDPLPRYALQDWVYHSDTAYEKLTEQLRTPTLKGFGLEGMHAAIAAAAAVLHYLDTTEHKERAHITSIRRLDDRRYVWMDPFTIRNLELLHPLQPQGHTLLEILDHTLTPMGGRLLRQWVLRPLAEAQPIQARQAVVHYFYENPNVYADLCGYLRPLGDMERLASKAALRRLNPRDALQLGRALAAIPLIQQLLQGAKNKALDAIAERLKPCSALSEEITHSIREDPALQASLGRIIQPGIDPQLDEALALIDHAKEGLSRIQRQEALRTNIPSLKVGHSKVFGYYLEVTHAHRAKAPTEWTRKQTLVNAERYTTPALLEYEDKMARAEDIRITREKACFDALLDKATAEVHAIQQNARAIAALDVLASWSALAQKNHYCLPVIQSKPIIHIQQGRHPVIEVHRAHYVPNDLQLDPEGQQILLITGPNMAGKSALLRQTALIVLMAQIGAFVPAKNVQMGCVDKIFTRVGGADNLSKGESTFMVEMMETANILHSMTAQSLVLMDEIGRGTSTYDGLAVAWAILEHLHNHPKHHPKTLFATHYHELSALQKTCKRIANYQVAVKEVDEQIVFLHTLIKGSTEQSFGINVARMAGLPEDVLMRAQQLLAELQAKAPQGPISPKSKATKPKHTPLPPHLVRIQQRLSDLNPDQLTPLQALMTLAELHQINQKKPT